MNKMIFLGALSWILIASPAFAADASLSVQVVPRQPTDTINDFDLTTLSSSSNSDTSGTVKGATTTADQSSNTFGSKWFLAAIFLAVLSIGISRHYKQKSLLVQGQDNLGKNWISPNKSTPLTI